MSVQCIRLLGFDFIGIEIAIGIEIGFRDPVGGRISLDAVAPSAQSTEHCGNAVQFNLTFPAFLLMIPRGSMDSAQRFGLPINPGNVLYREALNIQPFVSKSHGFSISIAIPISIWIIPTDRWMTIVVQPRRGWIIRDVSHPRVSLSGREHKYSYVDGV